VFSQIAAGTIAVWGCCFLFGVLPKRQELLRLSLPGILQPGLAFLFEFAGLTTTPVTIEGLLFSFEAILVLLLSMPLLRERPRGAEFAVAFLGLVGVGLMSGFDSSHAFHMQTGVLLILAGVICASLDTIASRAVAQHSEPLALTAVSNLSGLVVVALAILLWPHQDWRPLLEPGTFCLTFLSGCLLHGAAVFLFNAGLSNVEAAGAALLFPTISLLTAAGGYVFFGERLSGQQLWGAALIVASSISVGAIGGKLTLNDPPALKGTLNERTSNATGIQLHPLESWQRCPKRDEAFMSAIIDAQIFLMCVHHSYRPWHGESNSYCHQVHVHGETVPSDPYPQRLYAVRISKGCDRREPREIQWAKSRQH
jgi:drug/metabolite transporter (DMT)-like permease